jgi:3-oxoacyl-[acyl-carrier protein] reductase
MQIVGRTPLGRLATEEDILGLVRFLLSSAAGMITGQSILVDGGVSC